MATMCRPLSLLPVAPPIRQVKGREECGPERELVKSKNKSQWRIGMLDARARRKRREKLPRQTAQTVEQSRREVETMEEELRQLNSIESLGPAATPPRTWFMPSSPRPPGWSPDSSTAKINLTSELINELTEEDPKQMVLDGTVETAAADSGATSSCGVDTTSDCGRYKWKDPFVPTGKPSNKGFQYRGGALGVGKELKHLPYDVRGGAKEIHTVPGQRNHLISTNKFADLT